MTFCKNCGGTMVGDGYKMVRHCEFVDVPFDVEPDAGPIYCENRGSTAGRESARCGTSVAPSLLTKT